MRLKTKNRAFG